jgi:hypothetical protein
MSEEHTLNTRRNLSSLTFKAQCTFTLSRTSSTAVVCKQCGVTSKDTAPLSQGCGAVPEKIFLWRRISYGGAFPSPPRWGRTQEWQGRITAQEEIEDTLIAQTTFAGLPDNVIWHRRILFGEVWKTKYTDNTRHCSFRNFENVLLKPRLLYVSIYSTERATKF